MLKSSTPIGRMHEVYGTSSLDHCKKCCNYQKKEKGSTVYVCIAYSETEPWKESWTACSKMYNYPFRALRPRQKPLEEACSRKRSGPAGKAQGQEEINIQ